MFLKMSLLFIFESFLAFLAIFITWKFILKPYILFIFYKKQEGSEGFFSLGNQFLERFKKDAFEQGDFLFYMKAVIKRNPQVRFIVLNYAHTPILYITDPSYIKSFVKQAECYEKAYEILGNLKESKDKGLITQEGEDWKKSRKIFSSGFHFDFVKNFIPHIISVTSRYLESTPNDIQEILIQDYFNQIIGDLTGEFFFGKKFTDYKVEGFSLTKFATVSTDLRGKVNMSLTSTLFGPDFVELGLVEEHRLLKRYTKSQNEAYSRIIQELRESPTSKNTLMGIILNLDGTPDAYTEDRILAEFRLLHIAGIETTSNLLGISTYFLAQNPHCEEKILEESRRELSRHEKMNLDSLNRMEYTTAFLKECLRLAGPAPLLLPRVALKDHRIGDLQVKKGTFISVASAAIHRNPLYFTEPERFLPERFLQNGIFPEDKWRGEPFIIQYFSSGPRNCIGQNLALTEAKLVLGLTLLRYHIEYPIDYKLRLNLGFIYRPIDPLRGKLIKRENIC